MKQKLHVFAIHQTATSLQRTYNLNPGIRWYPALYESNRIKFAYFTIHPGKNPPPPQNGCQLKSFFLFFFIKSIGFTSLTFPTQLDFSQNQLATITLNTGSPQTLPVANKQADDYFACVPMWQHTEIKPGFDWRKGVLFH